MEGRLASLVEETGSPSFSQLVARAKADPTHALDRRIVDAITTGESMFFRDSAPFDLLRHKIVPEWIDRQRSAPRRTRIWSADSGRRSQCRRSRTARDRPPDRAFGRLQEFRRRRRAPPVGRTGG